MRVPLSVRDLRVCPACDKKPTRVSALETVPGVSEEEARELAELAVRIDRDGSVLSGERDPDGCVRHLVDVGEVVAVYRTNAKSKCSYDDHRHNLGLFFNTRCDVLLQIGKDCGKQCVDGWDEIKRDLDEADRADNERRLLADQPSTLLAAIAELAGEVELRLAGADELRRWLPKLYETMQRSQSARDREVQVPYFENVDGTRRKKFRTEILSGVKLFAKKAPRTAEVLALAQRYAQESNPDLVRRANLDELVAQRMKVERAQASLRRWLKESDGFWKKRNLALAFLKTWGETPPSHLTIEEDTIVMLRPDRRVFAAGGAEAQVGARDR